MCASFVMCLADVVSCVGRLRVVLLAQTQICVCPHGAQRQFAGKLFGGAPGISESHTLRNTCSCKQCKHARPVPSHKQLPSNQHVEPTSNRANPV